MPISKPCADCGTLITGATQKRVCADCRKRRRQVHVRALAPGETCPDGPPFRYVSSHGYVRLRWKVGLRSYVEAYEHRVVAGAVSPDEHVHHLNGVKSDNTPSNLVLLTAAEHAAAHRVSTGPRKKGGAERRFYDPATFIDLYGQGWSTQQVGRATGADPATVWRSLKRHGVQLRSENRVAIPKREQRKL